MAIKSSLLERFSQDTSVIMATMTELAQRILTKRPTVARTSETGIRLSASSPTRASDPRTEITRPNDVTMNEPGKSNGLPGLCTAVAGQTVKRQAPALRQIRDNSGARFVPNAYSLAEAPGKCCFFPADGPESA